MRDVASHPVDDSDFETYLAHCLDEVEEEGYEFGTESETTTRVVEDWEENAEPSINLTMPSRTVRNGPKDAAEEEASWW